MGRTKRIEKEGVAKGGMWGHYKPTTGKYL